MADSIGEPTFMGEQNNDPIGEPMFMGGKEETDTIGEPVFMGESAPTTATTVAKPTKPAMPGFVPYQYEGVNEVWGGIGAGVNAIVETAKAAPRSVLSGMYEGIASVVAPAAVSGVPGTEKAMEYLDVASKWARPKPGSEGEGYIGKTLESTSQSLTATYLTGRALGGKGKVSTIARGIAGKGVTFGFKQYYDFMKEVDDFNKANGIKDEEASKIRKELRPMGMASGAADSGGEILSDVLTARVFGLLGNKTVSEPVKNNIKQFLVNRLGLSTVGELGGENATTIAQYYAAKASNARMKEMTGKDSPEFMRQESLMKQLKDTSIVTTMQSLLTAGIAERISRSKDTGIEQTKETVIPAPIKQEGPSVKANITAPVVDKKTMKSARDEVNKQIEQERIRLAEEEAKAEEGEKIAEPAKVEDVNENKPVETEVSKEPVTFIGMQEGAKPEDTPIPLVNDKNKSTVTYNPEVHELTNPEEYENKVVPGKLSVPVIDGIEIGSEDNINVSNEAEQVINESKTATGVKSFNNTPEGIESFIEHIGNKVQDMWGGDALQEFNDKYAQAKGQIDSEVDAAAVAVEAMLKKRGLNRDKTLLTVVNPTESELKISNQLEDSIKKSEPLDWGNDLSTKKITPSKAIESKESHRKVITDARDNGVVPTDSVVRSTNEVEIAGILKDGKLHTGENAEGQPGISAYGIDQFAMQGDNFQLNAAIIAPRSAVEGTGNGVNEFLINPETDVNELKFVVKGEILTYGELKEKYGKKETAREKKLAVLSIIKGGMDKPVDVAVEIEAEKPTEPIATEPVVKPEKPKTKREERLAKVKKEKAVQKPKLVANKVNKIPKLTQKQVDLITGDIYETIDAAQKALYSLGSQGKKYTISGSDEYGYMLAHEADMVGHKTEHEVHNNPLFQTIEESLAVPRDTSTLVNATNSLHADINRFYHTAEGDIVSMSKALKGILEALENNPRQYAKQFSDPVDYNNWVEKLHDLADYITKVEMLRGPGNTMDFMGFQNAFNALRRIYNKHKAAVAFREAKAIQKRVNGGESINIINDIPKDIGIVSSSISSGRLPLLKDFPKSAQTDAENIMLAELWFRYNVETEGQIIKNMRDKLTDDQIKEVTKMSYEIEEYSRTIRRQLKKEGYDKAEADFVIEGNIDEYLEAYPDRKVVDSYKDIRQSFDAWRQRYKNHLVSEINRETPENVLNASRDFAVHKDLNKAFADNGVDTIADKKRFIKYLDEIGDVTSWGDEEYVTHMMVGDVTIKETITIVDEFGKEKTKVAWVSKGRTIEDAIRKSVEHAQEMYDMGRTVGDFTFDHSFAYDGEVATVLTQRQYRAHAAKLSKAIDKATKDINTSIDISDALKKHLKTVVGKSPSLTFAPPTIKSKHVLPGEEDIFEGMRLYSRVMWKKVAYDPVATDLQNHADKYEKNVRDYLNTMLKDSKGTYGGVDKVLDDFLDRRGIETSMSYTKYISNPITKLVVNIKLGYRPAAAMFNAIDGFTKILLDHNAHYMKEGIKFLHTPEGRALVEKNGWSLGNRFEEQGGHLKTKQQAFGVKLTGAKSLLAPMGIFTAPELPVRELNYAVAYLYYKDVKMAELGIKGKDADKAQLEQEAVDFATRAASVNVWKLQGSNTTAERPKVLRGSTGRMLGVFFPYFVRNSEFILSNARNFGFWAKYIPYQMIVGGPRSVIAFAKSIPFITLIMAARGVDDWWERLDKWMIENVPMSGGIASFFGMDVVAPATAQFPSSSSTIDTAFKLYKYVLSEVGQPNFKYSAKEGLKQTVVVAKNWIEIIDSHLDDYGRVLDENGKPKYSINSNWDKAVMAAGFTPESKTLQNLTHRIVARDAQLEADKARKTISEFRNELQDMFRRGADKNIVVERAGKTAYDAMLKYHVKPETITNVIRDIQMSREIRDLFTTNVHRKLEVNELQKSMEKKNPGILFPQSKEK